MKAAVPGAARSRRPGPGWVGGARVVAQRAERNRVACLLSRVLARWRIAAGAAVAVQDGEGGRRNDLHW